MSETTNLKLYKHDEPLETNTNAFDIDKSMNQNWDKIDSFAGTVNSKTADIESNIEALEKRTTSLETKVDKHDTDIEDLQSKSQELEEDSQAFRDFLSNIMPQGEAEGEIIKVTDSARLPCEIKIIPNDEQETSEASANILDLTKLELRSSSKCTVDSKSENEITITSTAEAGVSYVRFKIKLKAGTWYFNEAFEILEGNSVADTGKIFGHKPDWSLAFNTWQASQKVSFTLEEDTELYFSFNVKGSADETTDIIKIRFYNLMFTKENIDYTPFIPQKPSFEYPSEIETVKNKINLKIQNKNIAPINETDWELTENNTIKNKARNAGLDLTEFDLKKGQTVKVSIKMVSKPSVSTSFSGYVDGTNVSSFGFNWIHGFNLNQIYTRTYTATEDCRIKYTLWGNANSDIFEFQLWAELDDTTDYIVHEEQNYELDIQQEMLAGDKIDLKNDKEVHHFGFIDTYQKNDIKVTEVQSSGEYKRYSCDLKATDRKLKETLKIFCTHLEYAGSRWNDVEGICGWENGTNFCIVTTDENLNTADKLKTFLISNHVKLYYELATPTELDLTETQKNQLKEMGKAYTYKGTTNISTDSVAIVDLKYSKDIETLLAVTEEE